MNKTHEVKKINQIITNEGLRMKHEGGLVTEGTTDGASVPEAVEEKTE